MFYVSQPRKGQRVYCCFTLLWDDVALEIFFINMDNLLNISRVLEHVAVIRVSLASGAGCLSLGRHSAVTRGLGVAAHQARQ